MRILIVHCHPDPDSFSGRIMATARTALAHHEVSVIDLYEERFDPVMAREEWRRYMSDPTANFAEHAEHIAALEAAEALLMIYPTWFYGPPARLKGWLERVWLPGVAFDVDPNPQRRVIGKLRNIKHCAVVTTSGSPRWWLWLIRDPGRNMVKRGLRGLFHPRCKMHWWQLFDMDHVSDDDRRRFLVKLERELGKL